MRESMSTATESRASRTIRDAMETGRPLVYIRSSEEQRVARVLAEVSRRSGDVPVWTWSLTEGLRRDGCPAEPGTADARKVLDFIIGHGEAAIFHLEDFHEPLRDSAE